jgi:hypothetical protein
VTPRSWRPGLDRGGPGALGFGQPPLAAWGSTGGVAWCHGFSFLGDCQRAGRQICCRASLGPNKSLDLASRCGLAPPVPAHGTPNLESRWGSTSAYIQSGLDPPGPAHRTPNLDARWGPTVVKICPALAWLPQDPPAGRQIWRLHGARQMPRFGFPIWPGSPRASPRDTKSRVPLGPNGCPDLASLSGLAPPGQARGTPNLAARWGSTSAQIGRPALA